MPKTAIRCIRGSILDENLAEGIAIFIPVGLTGIRPDSKDFIFKTTGKPMCGGAGCYKAIGSGILKYVLYVDNSDIKVSDIEDMRRQINEVLDIFVTMEVKNIAMNGIRCDDRPDQNVRPEQYLRTFVEEYLAGHPDAFDKISLVDAHGGFGETD